MACPSVAMVQGHLCRPAWVASCWWGASCPNLRRGCCLFRHSSDEVAAASLVGQDSEIKRLKERIFEGRFPCASDQGGYRGCCADHYATFPGRGEDRQGSESRNGRVGFDPIMLINASGTSHCITMSTSTPYPRTALWNFGLLHSLHCAYPADQVENGGTRTTP